MRTCTRVVLSGALVLLLAPCPSTACTSFALGDTLMVAAKNYDWEVGIGMVVVNQRDTEKSFSIVPDLGASTWTSRYGSVTFTQYGRDLPLGGMNEKGLVVEVLWLEGSEYPPDDERVDVECTQWIQYVLDTAATTADGLASLSHLQVRSQVPLHLFMADRRGHAATVEFLDGREVIHAGASMPIAVLTNVPYDAALAYAEGRRNGTMNEEERKNSSRNRFLRVATMIEHRPAHAEDLVSYAFDILAAVSFPDWTQWSIVYDQTHGVIHYRTREAPERRSISMDARDFECGTPVLIADIDGTGVDGAVTWSSYTRQANLTLVRRAYAATDFLAGTPDSLRVLVASYPDRSHCTR